MWGNDVSCYRRRKRRLLDSFTTPSLVVLVYSLVLWTGKSFAYMASPPFCLNRHSHNRKHRVVGHQHYTSNDAHRLSTETTASFQQSLLVLWGGSDMELGDEEIVTNKNSNHLNEPESTTNGADVSPSDGEIMLRMFKDHLLPDSKCDVTQMGPTSLAYIGDVIFELFVRTRYVWPARRTSDLQNKVVNVVRAETQSIILQRLMESSWLTSLEEQVLKRGRNAGTGTKGRKRGPKRLYSKNSGDVSSSETGGASVYQDSTALEALIGYLYISDMKRCMQLLEWLKDHLDDTDPEQ
mmetsp:Transcript_11095/g.20240  ORF Transcript_11095/g.20240 Transcript_11095/m.20240 type:complete len:295 (-) Transcript_11095:1071-1955(-)